MGVPLRPTLFDSEPPAIDSGFGRLERRHLGSGAWIDLSPAWLSGSDRVFAALLERARWHQRQRLMFDRFVDEPRLTASWFDDEELEEALPVLSEIRSSLGARYRVSFDSGSLNLYRDGRDGVAWHRDKIPSHIRCPIVAIVSVGGPRRFLLRPRGGGRSVRLQLGRGDLLVTGGSTQRIFEHCVPKVASAPPRISIMLRHLGPAGGSGETSEPGPLSPSSASR